MTDIIEWHPKRHGHKPDFWTPDTLTGLDGKNYVRQPNWAWIAGTTYYVPYEAVHGRPRPATPETDESPALDLEAALRRIAELEEALQALQADTLVGTWVGSTGST